MNNIIKPLREELDELKSEIELMEAQREKGILPQESEIVLSCDKAMLGRFEKAYYSCLAEYEKIKGVDNE